jgi:trehalose/maltose hydrolase-like predicted phosphorylase
MPWAEADGEHYPGLYFAGCYNPLASEIEGETEWNESIVNLPNGLRITWRIGDGDWFSLDTVELLHYEQTLDLFTGVMRRTARCRDSAGRITTIEEERFVSMAAANLVGQRIALTPHNWSGPATVRCEIDGSVINNNIEKHADYAHKHLRVLKNGGENNTLLLLAETINSNLFIAVRTKDLISAPFADVQIAKAEEKVLRTFSVEAGHGQRLTIDRLMAVCVGKDDHVVAEAAKVLEGAETYDRCLEQHCSAWQELWGKMPIASADKKIEGAQHLTLFHLLQNFSPLTLHRDASLPARGWQEVYRGQIFWDEMFSVPILSVRFPELARELLLYRHSRLEAARENAHSYGLKGALYPWRSARTGAEETPRFQKSPINGHWREDHTAHQVHINASIAWDIFHYVWATGDEAFLHAQGAEMLVAICRMWASLAVYDPEADRFDIGGIVGPDEFHTRYPHRPAAGIDNNAYTNAMAAWTLGEVLEALASAPQAIRQKLEVTQAETELWDQLSRRLRIPFMPDGLISQFMGVEQLEELDPESLGEESADWELEARGKDVIDYQLFKQADFAMLLYLFRAEELQTLLGRLGYAVSKDQLNQSVEYYRARTSHGSSLSQISYAGALSHFDRHLSYKTWRDALAPDLDPESAESAAQGLHLGAMAAGLDVLQRHYLGLTIRADGVELEPNLPNELPPVELAFCYRGGQYELAWDESSVQLRSGETNAATLRVVNDATSHELAPGETIVIGSSPPVHQHNTGQDHGNARHAGRS